MFMESNVKEQVLASDRNGAYTQVCLVSKPMTLPMAGYVGWFGRMKNVGNDTKPRLEYRGKKDKDFHLSKSKNLVPLR